jgi:hypothetical protein
VSGRSRHPAGVSAWATVGPKRAIYGRRLLHLRAAAPGQTPKAPGAATPGAFRLSGGWLGAEGEAELPVKSGAGHNRAGCSRTGLAIGDALGVVEGQSELLGGQAEGYPPAPLNPP